MEEFDFKSIWKSAGENKSKTKKYSLEDIQLYRKKKSKQISRSSRLGILFDIFYKCVVVIEFAISLIIFNDQYPFQLIIGFLLAVTCILAAVELGFLKKLRQITESVSIIENLRQKLDFIKTSYKKFIFIGAFSNPLFVIAGFFLYYYFKYNRIKMGAPFEDPVLYLFPVIAYLISLLGQWPFYKNQLRELKESIEDIEDSQIASVKIEEAKKRRRKLFIISSIVILIGVLILLIFLMR